MKRFPVQLMRRRSAGAPQASRASGTLLAAFALLLTVAAGQPRAAAAHDTHFGLLPQPSTDLACASTPFGHRLTVGQDDEMIDVVDMLGSTNGNDLHAWSLTGDAPPAAPLEATIEGGWRSVVEDGSSTLLKVVRADLNGDGEDEIVLALGTTEHGGSQLKIVVLERDPNAYFGFSRASVWQLNRSFTGFDMVAGDFTGSTDGHEQLALMLESWNPAQADVYVLTGNATGGIANASNSWSGHWSWQPPSHVIGSIGIGAGHLLPDGREQMAVVAESNQNSAGGSNRKLYFHLLEYDSTTPALQVASGSENIRSKSFERPVGSMFDTPNGGADIDSIYDIKVNTGDVAGDSDDELLIDIGFQIGGGDDHTYAVMQYLQHFRATRDSNNQVTDVSFATRDNGKMFDSGFLVDDNVYVKGDWDVTIHNVDDQPKAEIVFVRNQPVDGTLHVDIYKVAPELTASFRYYATGNYAQFHDDSVGFDVPIDADGTRWNFGDGHTSDAVDPGHKFAGPGTYNVTLSVRQTVDTPSGAVTYTDSYTLPVTINSGTNQGGGVDPSTYMFQTLTLPYYQASYIANNMQAFDPVRVAVGDMDRDGTPEIMTLARMGTDNSSGSGLLRSLWSITYDSNHVAHLTGRHQLTQGSSNVPIGSLTGLALVAADFDGDSVEATIGGDCRTLTEEKLHQVVWAPPYFDYLQSGAPRSASFGTSHGAGHSAESSYGTSTGTAITGYVGVDLGVDIAGIIGATSSLRVTAGRNEESSASHSSGSEDSFALTQGLTQSTGSGLVTTEANRFNCYEYDISQASVGLDPDSSLRICRVDPTAGEPAQGGTSPEYWNTEFPKIWAAASQGHAPPEWVPVTRDWASLALFKPVTSNFVNQADASKLTDGLFSTSIATQAGDLATDPYLEVDLGSVQDINIIRVFAPEGHVTPDLSGFHVYTSTSPMPTTGLPSGPDVHEFVPDAMDGTVRGRWNIWARVGGPASDPYSQPLRARYIRLQKAGHVAVAVGELQVFGDAHQDPPRYPDAVCDHNTDDKLFLAKVWDPAVKAFRAIEVHGSILWLGTRYPSGESWANDGMYLKTCINDAKLWDSAHNFNIWPTQTIGNESELGWSLETTTGGSNGRATSFESSTSVGAEFEVTASIGASFVAGGSKEYSSGVSRDYQSSTFWSDSLDLGGSIGGFQPPRNGAEYVTSCAYSARPYAYKLEDQSNTGYTDTMYVVDYVVPQGTLATAWQRGAIAARCGFTQPGDGIFRDGFDPD